MKKYIFFIVFSLSLLFLLPLNIYAEDGFGQVWKRCYKDINYTQLQHSNNYDINFIDLNGGARGNAFLYPQGFTFNAKSYDYITGAGMLHSDNLGGIYIEDYNVSSSENASFGLGFTLLLEGNTDNSSTISRGATCTIYPTSQTNDELYFTYNCPVVNDMTKIVQFKFILHNNCDYILNQTCSTNSSYSFSVGISPTINVHYLDNSQEQIIEAQENTTNAINDMNSSITDSSGNNNSDNANAIQGFENQVASNNTISSLITMPITLYQKILNSVNGTCAPFNMGSLLGSNIVFPCINPATYLGSNLWSIIDVICSGLLVFAISKRFIKIFDGFTSMSTTKDEVGD